MLALTSSNVSPLSNVARGQAPEIIKSAELSDISDGNATSSFVITPRFTNLRPPSSLSLSSNINLPTPLQSTFNLVDELELNRERYYAHTSDSPAVTIKNYPIAIMASIENLCRLVLRYKAGITIGSAACIAGGLSTIYANEHVQSLLGLRSRFGTIRDLSGDPEIHTLIATWFKQFELDLPWGEGHYRLTVPLPLGVYTPLADLAFELGVSNPTLAKVCMMVTLCAQTEVLDGYRESMGAYVASFWHRAWIRAEGTRCLLERFGL